MRSIFGFIAAVLLAAAIVSPAPAAIPTVSLDLQSWWNPTGIRVADAVGKHDHFGIRVPVTGTVLSEPFDVPATIRLHANAGARIRHVHIQAWYPGGNTTLVDEHPGWTCSSDDCVFTATYRLDPSRTPRGRVELRFQAITDLPDGTRMYPSSGVQECFYSCANPYRSTANFTEARSWYTARGYAIARITTDIGRVCSGGSIGIKLAEGASGLTTRLAGVYVDLNAHDGDAGTVLLSRPSSFVGTISFPGAGHRLALLSADPNNGAVLVVDCR